MTHHYARLVAVAIATVSFSTPITAQQESDDNSANTIIVPTEMCRGYFLIPLTLAPREGYAEDRTLWLLHDTGAGATYIDPDSIERVTGRRFRVGQRANIRNATAGIVSYDPIRIRIQELDHLSHALGRYVDGIMGFTVFDDVLLTLDYSNHEMRLDRGQLPPPDGETIFDADGPDYRPWITIDFSDRSQVMLIDSGAARYSLAVKELKQFETILPPRLADSAIRMRDVERRSAARASEDARIGPHTLIAPTLLSTSGTQFIGGQVMRYFIWTFDQSTERVRMVRHDPDTPITFKPVYGHGMVLGHHREGFRIEDILANTPASNADVQAGDIITHWNGVTATAKGCEPEGHNPLTLTIRRDSTVLDVILDFFPLVD